MKLRGTEGSLSHQLRRRVASRLYMAPTVDDGDWPRTTPAAREAIAIARSHSMIRDRGLQSLYDQIVYLERGMPGAVVECGVWKGGAAAVMAHANLRHGTERRRFHLFDSFEGIPQPVAGLDGKRAVRDARGNAKEALGGPITVGYDYAELGGPGSIAAVSALFELIGYPSELVEFHVGWFQDRVPTDASSIGSVALLHLDGDWYESTKICLDHLYANVSSGGFVVIDDYGTYDGCRRAVDAFLAALPGRGPFLNWVNRDIAYLIKP